MTRATARPRLTIAPVLAYGRHDRDCGAARRRAACGARGARRIAPTAPLLARLDATIAARATEALARCSYRRAAGRWAGGESEWTVAVGQREGASGGSDRVWSDNGKWSGRTSFLRATVRRTWIAHVEREGIAVVAGRFVADALRIAPDRWVAHVVESAPGFAVRFAARVIVRASDGTLSLRSVGDLPDGLSLDDLACVRADRTLRDALRAASALGPVRPILDAALNTAPRVASNDQPPTTANGGTPCHSRS